ncbi:MAG: hypothetical protein ACOX4L_01250 [Bacillota bacterium]|jgi:DNA-directed RNA polymerase sigma subunit (sigma70/sigma32)
MNTDKNQRKQQEAAFVLYIKKAIQFKAIRLYNSYAKQCQYEKLILDVPIDDQDSCLRDFVSDDTSYPFQEDINDSIDNLVVNPLLYNALQKLSQYQKDVLKAVIVDEIPEKIYARKYGVTRQAINKLKNSALLKIANYINKETHKNGRSFKSY